MALFQSLEFAADRLDQHAAELRQRVSTLSANARSLDWNSPAAALFHKRSATLELQMRQCADGLDHAAHTLRRHAHTARERSNLLNPLNWL